MTVKIHQVTLLRVLGLGLREEDLHQTLHVHQVPQADQARVPVQKTGVIGINTRSAVKSQNTSLHTISLNVLLRRSRASLRVLRVENQKPNGKPSHVNTRKKKKSKSKEHEHPSLGCSSPRPAYYAVLLKIDNNINREAVLFEHPSPKSSSEPISQWNVFKNQIADHMQKSRRITTSFCLTYSHHGHQTILSEETWKAFAYFAKNSSLTLSLLMLLHKR